MFFKSVNYFIIYYYKNLRKINKKKLRVRLMIELSSAFKLKNIYVYIYIWLCRVLGAARGLYLIVVLGLLITTASPVAEHGLSACRLDFIWLWCTGFSLPRLLLLQSMVSRPAGWTLSGCGAWASHHHGFSCCRAWALDLLAQ